ncbi:MAG: AtpZ/AtpI family protein [Candidatus Kapaibacterium sp.]
MSRNPPRLSSGVIRELAPYMAVGTQLTVTVLLFAAIGWWLDGKWSSGPLCIGIGTGVGSVIGLVNMIRSLTSLSKARTLQHRDEHTAIPTEK